jgi:hypothetical protein
VHNGFDGADSEVEHQATIFSTLFFEFRNLSIEARRLGIKLW